MSAPKDHSKGTGTDQILGIILVVAEIVHHFDLTNDFYRCPEVDLSTMQGCIAFDWELVCSFLLFHVELFVPRTTRCHNLSINPDALYDLKSTFHSSSSRLSSIVIVDSLLQFQERVYGERSGENGWQSRWWSRRIARPKIQSHWHTHRDVKHVVRSSALTRSSTTMDKSTDEMWAAARGRRGDHFRAWRRSARGTVKLSEKGGKEYASGTRMLEAYASCLGIHISWLLVDKSMFIFIVRFDVT